MFLGGHTFVPNHVMTAVGRNFVQRSAEMVLPLDECGRKSLNTPIFLFHLDTFMSACISHGGGMLGSRICDDGCWSDFLNFVFGKMLRLRLRNAEAAVSREVGGER